MDAEVLEEAQKNKAGQLESASVHFTPQDMLGVGSRFRLRCGPQLELSPPKSQNTGPVRGGLGQIARVGRTLASSHPFQRAGLRSRQQRHFASQLQRVADEGREVAVRRSCSCLGSVLCGAGTLGT